MSVGSLCFYGKRRKFLSVLTGSFGLTIFVLCISSGDDEINLAGGPSKFVTDVAVNNEGKCLWSGPATFKVNCHMNVGKWPFDEQSCEMAFGSYSYGLNLLRIKLFKDTSAFTSEERYNFVRSLNGRFWYHLGCIAQDNFRSRGRNYPFRLCNTK